MYHTPVIFQSGGYQKQYHHLNEEEHNLVAKALFTGFGKVGSDGIVIGRVWSDDGTELTTGQQSN